MTYGGVLSCEFVIMALSVQDRVASIQSGGLGAISVGMIASFFELLHVILGQYLEDIQSFQSISVIQSLESIIFAAVSGFLFGVTYRYICRDEDNPHLRTGAIAAFGLTRGLAQIDVGLLLQGDVSWLLLLAGESMVMVAIAAVGLDFAMQKEWIQRISE